jgi:hypothetical protein
MMLEVLHGADNGVVALKRGATLRRTMDGCAVHGPDPCIRR